jgi:hypothetical protein
MRYLILTYFKKPNGQIDESMTVSNKLRNRDLSMGNVILDFKKLAVLKCSMGDVTVPKDFDRIAKYYHQHYAATIERLFNENGYEIVKPEKEPVQPQPADPS